jgi:Fe-Mn family superoxide dismutase
MTPYSPKNFERLVGMEGFSEKLLRNHFSLYEGYVAQANALAKSLAAFAAEGKKPGPEHAELRRRFGWEYGGMRLHELYFENLSRQPRPLSKGSPLARRIGWVVTYYDADREALFNAWINEHDTGHLAACVPVLVLDVFEHAYLLDYGIKKDGYLDAFMAHVDWPVAAERLK